jgi:RHS repeat-associated protein
LAGAVGTDTSASRAESNYNYFRDYDPSIGRYAESDPIGLLASLNTYTYVDDNPLFWGDRFGLQRGPAPAETYYSRGRIMPNPMSY